MSHRRHHSLTTALEPLQTTARAAAQLHRALLPPVGPTQGGNTLHSAGATCLQQQTPLSPHVHQPPLASIPSGMPDLTRSQAGADPSVGQLAVAMQQLQVQFGSIASSLTLVVEQLAQLTKTQQQIQQQQQQAATTTPPRTLQPAHSLSNSNRTTLDSNTPLSSTTAHATANASRVTPPTFHDDRSPEAAGSSGLEVHSPPLLGVAGQDEDEVIFGSQELDRSNSASPRSRSRSRSHSRSSSSASGRSSDDEEGSPQANRLRKAQDDELENEISSKVNGSGLRGGKERSLSSRQKATVRHKVVRALSQVAEKSLVQPAQAVPSAVNNTSSSTGGGLDLGNIILIQQQATHAQQHRTMSLPSVPPSSSSVASSSASTTAAHPLHAAHHHHGHTSPTLPSMLRTARGTSTTSIPASATALPLDAPESAGAQHVGGSATTSPRHHASGSTGTSPTHMLAGTGSTQVNANRTGYHAISSPRSSMHGSLGGGGGGGSSTTSPLHRGQSHSVSVESLSDLHASHIFLGSENKLKLNVGGQLFCTTLTTLLREPTSMFSAMFSGRYAMDVTGPTASGSSRAMRDAVFIDRDPTMFRHVLNYLRDGQICLEGMTSTQKKALIKEARYFGLHGLLSLLQLDSRATKTAQRRELSSEKEYKFVEDIPQKDLARQIKEHSLDGYEFENWILAAAAPQAAAGTKGATSSSTKPMAAAATGCVHLLFSKKLSRGELMLLDRLQNHM